MQITKSKLYQFSLTIRNQYIKYSYSIKHHLMTEKWEKYMFRDENVWKMLSMETSFSIEIIGSSGHSRLWYIQTNHCFLIFCLILNALLAFNSFKVRSWFSTTYWIDIKKILPCMPRSTEIKKSFKCWAQVEINSLIYLVHRFALFKNNDNN